MTKIQTLMMTTTLGLAMAGTAFAQKPAAAPAGPAVAKKAPAPAAPAAAPAPAAAAPAAAPAAPAGPPQPSKELEAYMKPLEGSWKCETKFAANAFGPGSAAVTAKSTVKFKKDLGGFFYRGEYEVKKQKDLPMAFTGILFVGFDPGSKQVLLTSVDNGGGLATETGKIEGESATMTGEAYMMGMKVKVRETMGSKGAKEAFHKFDVDMGKGWMPMGEDNCKK